MSSGNGVPVFIDIADPVVIDPAIGLSIGQYRAANAPAEGLARCLEAVRDLKTVTGLLSLSPDPWNDRRLVKMLVTPLHSLASTIDDLHGILQESEAATVSKKEKKARVERRAKFKEKVSFGKGGNLTAVRNKLAAHVDKDALMKSELWAHIDLRSLAEMVRACLNELSALLSENAYAWTCHSDDDSRVRLMSCDGSLVDLALIDGKPEFIASVTFTKSPREAISREMTALFDALCGIVAGNSGGTTNG